MDKKEVNISYRYGLEFECVIPFEGYDALLVSQDTMHGAISLFAFGGDGSIRNEGRGESREIRAARPLTINELVPAVEKLSQECAKAKVFVNASCGFHLHMSSEHFFDSIIIKKIIMTWTAIEDVLLTTQPASRMNNNYCKRFLTQFLDNQHDQVRFSRVKDKLVNNLSRNYRRQALNLCSLAKHGSIEIRLHAGTTNADKILNWVYLMTAMFDYAIKYYDKKNIMQLFKTEISEAKIDAVFKELRVSDDVASFYRARIEKHLFKTLIMHNKTALSNLDLLLKIRKEKKKLSLLKKQYNITTDQLERDRIKKDYNKILSITQEYGYIWSLDKQKIAKQEVLS